MYDFAVVGAGINGCAIAYELAESGKKVLVLDKEFIAAGGSGAAGAFIAPKFSKSGPLKELVHHSFLYAKEFYTQKFPEHFTQIELLHLAHNEKTTAMLQAYKKTTPLKTLQLSKEHLTQNAKEACSIGIEAGVVDAKAMCEALCSGSDFIQEEIASLQYQDNFWFLNEKYKAKNVVVATGAYLSILPEKYVRLRGVWGHRVDIATQTQNSISLHQEVSISPNRDGIIAVGATHNLSYHPQTTQEPYDFKAGQEELLQKASKTLLFKDDIQIVKDYVGLRSGSADYMPILGNLVDSQKTFESGLNLRRKKIEYSKFTYHKGLYIINGSSGYGFVLAPYLAKVLKEFILERKPLAKELDVARFFAKEARS